MDSLKIQIGIVESILHSAKHTYPDEFLALLGINHETGIIDELVIVPAIYGKNFSTFRRDLVPFDSKIVGSVHSHPSESNEPSEGDLNSFARTGNYHLIVAYPYSIDNLAAYNAKGNKLKLVIVEADPNFI